MKGKTTMTKTIEQIKESLFMNTVLVEVSGITWKDDSSKKAEDVFIAVPESVWNEYSNACEKDDILKMDRFCSLLADIIETFCDGIIADIEGIDPVDNISGSCSNETVILIPDKVDFYDGAFTIFPVKSLPEIGSVSAKDIVWDTYDEDTGTDIPNDDLPKSTEITFNSRIDILQYLFDKVWIADILTEKFGFCVKSIGSIE